MLSSSAGMGRLRRGHSLEVIFEEEATELQSSIVSRQVVEYVSLGQNNSSLLLLFPLSTNSARKGCTSRRHRSLGLILLQRFVFFFFFFFFLQFPPGTPIIFSQFPPGSPFRLSGYSFAPANCFFSFSFFLRTTLLFIPPHAATALTMFYRSHQNDQSPKTFLYYYFCFSILPRQIDG